MITRREGLAAGLAAATLAQTGNAAALTPAQLDAALAPENRSPEIVPIWPRNPPGLPRGVTQDVVERATPPALRDRYTAHVTRPVLIVFRPERPNGAGMLITPGGGYVRVVLDKEGYESAERFAQAGVTSFVLTYRLPGDGHAAGADAPLQDAQRAMRFIRANAASYGIDPARLGVMGFSAGGHAAGLLTLRFDAEVYERVDAADAQSAKPAFSVLVYPVATMSLPLAHAGSRRELIGEAPSLERERAYSLEHITRSDAPPTFLMHAADDDGVPVENSLQLYAALRAARVPGELHIFESGGHGFGTRAIAGRPTQSWPDLVRNWLSFRGVIPA